ncbi:cytosolic sulfotransferase 15-like [Prosopis cineraria]|uniref:cytosolic sulfotransferase 15-like n=1 Tax=Prosopis cineraria TaxID=364024 RepID=UPI00240F8A85|nr:cytosolic sulfotransferase 15-like [Prosopis cineraria]
MAETTTTSFKRSHSGVELENEACDEEYEKLSQEFNRKRFSPSQNNHPLLSSNPREEALESYSNCIYETGPFWTNMLGYWRESKERPNKVLFLRYEDLKGDIKFYLERIAEFLDCPFNSVEESEGVIENIIELCSSQKMKELEVNKTGKFVNKFENRDFLRKGEVGDWFNHFLIMDDKEIVQSD